MRVRIEVFATLRELMGKECIEVENANTVRELIQSLIEMFGMDVKEILMEGDKSKEFVKILVNGKDVRTLRGMETELKDGDVVSIFPPVAGG